MSDITLGEKIKQARLEKKLSRQEVVGDFITTNMLSKIENNAANPSIKTVEYLAQKLEKPVGYFLESIIDLEVDENKEGKKAFEHSSILIKKENFDEAIEYLNQKLKEVTVKSDSLYYPRLLLNLGKSCYYISNFKESHRVLLDSLNYLCKNCDYYSIAQAYYYIGSIYIHTLDFTKAEEHLRESINSLGKSYTEDILLTIKSYYKLGYSQYHLEKFEDTIASFELLIKLSKKHNTFYQYGQVTAFLGKVYFILNDYSKSEYYLKKSLKFFDLHDDFRLKASIQKDLGVVYMHQDDIGKAKDCLNNALEYYDANCLMEDLNITKALVIGALVKESSYGEGIEYFKTIDVRHLGPYDQSRLYINIGKCYYALSDLTNAEAILFKAESMLINFKDFKALSDTYSILAEIHSSTGNYKDAFKFSNKAREVMQNLLSQPSKATSLKF